MIIEASGTQTAVISTEHTLADLTNTRTYVAYADVSNMVSGDSLELRVYTKVLSGSTLRCLYYQLLTDAQTANGGQLQVAIPVPSDQEFKFTLKQTAGTGRAYDWKVVSI